MFRFLQPEWLWLLALLPLAIFWRGRVGPVAAIQYSNTSLARKVTRQTRSQVGHWLWLLPILAAALLIVGLARPQMGHTTAETQASGIDILLALDISGSMQALDFKDETGPKHRIDLVKKIVGNFVDDRPSDRLGLIAFAGAPYLVSPLTLDHDWLQQNLERVHIGDVEDGTAIGSAIASGVNRLRGTKAKSKIMILLTDGMSNMGKISPLAAAEAAKTLGIKVYTIGVGVKGKAPIEVKDQFGQTQIVYEEVDVDEETLHKIAEETGAKFYRATDTNSLIKIYSEINQLEKTTYTVKKFENYQELFKWLVLPAILILALSLLLETTRYRRLP